MTKTKKNLMRKMISDILARAPFSLSVSAPVSLFSISIAR